jgi:hypothetical protein
MSNGKKERDKNGLKEILGFAFQQPPHQIEHSLLKENFQGSCSVINATDIAFAPALIAPEQYKMHSEVIKKMFCCA